MQNTLATNADAELIMKLYELRTEATMRRAREWMVGEFWPSTAAEFFAVQGGFGSPENAYFRQVHTYWEMAAAFVLHGALSAELFLDCNSENIFLYAKFHSLLPEIREKAPTFFSKTGELIDKYQSAQQRLERTLKSVEGMRANRTNKQ